MKIKLKAFFLFAVLWLTCESFAQTIVLNAAEIAQERYWLLLLHYKGGTSEAAASDFFFSPEGRKNPRAELEATVKAFATPPDTAAGFFGQHPQCAFPERYRFLKNKLSLNLNDVPCPELQAWKTRIAAKSVTLVYASPYLNQAASMFGHSFLRINSGSSALNSHGVSFEATSGPVSPLGYIFKGLFGGFPGVFSQSAYVDKVKTYAHLEARDLWEYDLSLKPDEIDRMLNHLWELQNATFPYYFTNGNCSYHLLSLIEVARPQWHLRERFRLHAIPLDTVSVVAQIPEAVVRVHYRPAVEKELRLRLNSLTADERKIYRQRLQDPRSAKAEDGAEVLDAVLESRKRRPPEDRAADLHLLNLRAQLPAAKPFTTSAAERPDKGHRSRKLGLSALAFNGQPGGGVFYRPALHDLQDPDTGYIPFSSLVVGEAAVDHVEGRTAVNHFTLGEVLNLAPFSWSASAGFFRPTEDACFECLTGRVQVGGGSRLLFANEKVILFGLLKAAAESHRLGPSVEIANVIRWDRRLSTRLSTERFLFFRGRDREEITHLTASAAYAVLPLEFRFEAQTVAFRGSHQTNLRLSLGWFH